MKKSGFFIALTTLSSVVLVLVMVSLLISCMSPFEWGGSYRYGSNGERIYFTSESSSGEPITYSGSIRMMHSITCSNCHGPEGKGGRVSMMMSYFDAVSTGDPARLKIAKEAFFNVARGCIADGAEVIIVGCGGLGPLLVLQGVTRVDNVPIIDSVTCALIMAEELIALEKLGISVSRRLMYRKPKEEDWKAERKIFGLS